MAVAIVANQATLSRSDVEEAISALMGNGMTLQEAGSAFLEEIKRQALQDELLDLIGLDGVCEIWRQVQRRRRPAAVLHARSVPAQQAVVPGPRRHDMKQLDKDTSLLEGLWPLNGDWVVLGDMDRAMCSKKHLEASTVLRTWTAEERWWARLKDSLSDGDRIRQKWDEERLLKLYELCEQAKP